MTADVMPARLIAERYAARDINLYEFAPVGGGVLPEAVPGAHIDVHLPGAVVRQFSVVMPEARPLSYVVGVKRDPEGRGGSLYMHDQLRVGTVLNISPPRCHFALDEAAPHSVLIAGGIGITPIWSMVQRLERLGASWSLSYASRSRADAAFLAELERRSGVAFHFDDEAGGRVLDVAAVVAAAPSGAHLYCCGPKPMLGAFERATAGLPAGRVHVEYFTAKQEAATAGGFRLKLARSGLELTVAPGQSILEAVRAAGIDVPSSCEEGICGSCETRIVAGLADHRDSILSEAERAAGETMMICCSGAKGDELVLDL